MPYFGVDDGFAFHRKALRAGNAAIGLWTRAGSWCNQQLTDGFVPSDMVEVLGTEAQAARLVSSGLWLEADGGYQFHEWTEEGRNFTRAQVLAKRAKEREKKANARAAKSAKAQVGKGSPLGTPSGIPGDNTGDTPGESRSTHPIPSQEEQKKTTSSSPRKRGTRIPDSFIASPEMVSWARERTPHVDGKRETEKFINYWSAKSGKDAVKVDWEATWRNWMLNAAERASPRASPNGEMHPTDAAVLRLLNPDVPLRALPGGAS
jgi:hypothetical protein